MNKLFFVFVLMFLMFLLSGCSTNESNHNEQIISVKLTCYQSFQSCEDKYYEDENSINLFREAVGKAEKMDGEINYIAEYNLIFTTSINEKKRYHLSLGTSSSANGLLVALTNTNQGYRIPFEQANELRSLIKKK